MTNARSGTSPSAFVHHHALDTDESALAGLRAHIYRLENRIIGLEKITNDPQLRYGSIFARSVLGTSKRNTLGKSSSESKEAMMFRGKGFKTQFFGASHSTSYLTHVGPQCPNLSRVLRFHSYTTSEIS